MQGSRQKLLKHLFPVRSTSVVDSGCWVLGFVSMAAHGGLRCLPGILGPGSV